MGVMYIIMPIVGGLVLLYFGAEGLVRGSSRLALRSGLSPLTVGLTVVAFGTSSPELAVSLEAAIVGREAIALGNVVGSNIANLALILGVAAIIRPMVIQSKLVRLDLPILASCSALLTLLLLDRGLGRLEGVVLVLGLIAYVALNIRNARREHAHVKTEYAQALPRPKGSLWLDVVLVGVGLALLIVGGGVLINGAVAAAEMLGVTEAFVGLTIVALATSLPELATSMLAAFRGEGDIALGNLVGSNVFNILGVLGPAAIIRPMQGTALTILDLGTMTLVAFLVLPLMRTGFRLNRVEGGILAAVYGGYMYALLS